MVNYLTINNIQNKNILLLFKVCFTVIDKFGTQKIILVFAKRIICKQLIFYELRTNRNLNLSELHFSDSQNRFEILEL